MYLLNLLEGGCKQNLLGVYCSGTEAWLKLVPNFWSAKIRRELLLIATKPSGHCSEENPLAYSNDS